jgi:hypothetical protein
MDFPVFFVDHIGNRLIIAVVAILHVFINHPLAVGAYPLVTLMEWLGWKRGSEQIDRLAYKVTMVLFIVTTTIGALTGVGIWFTTAVIAPFGIGSLLRIFFWAWFIEWLVFITEVVLILIYFLTWKRWKEGFMKKVHIGVGIVLSLFSWLTMAIIVAILGFMMDAGSWPLDRSLTSAFFNPLYAPQLLFRTTYALMTAGLCVWFLLFFFTQKGTDLRRKAVRFVSIWTLVWVPPFVVGALWYWNVVPEAMMKNLDVALLTQAFQNWHETLAHIMVAALAAIIVTAVIGLTRPRLINGVLLLVPFLLGIWLLGHFERVREFVRKPYVVADYMYSNGVRLADYPVYKRDGVLTHATFVAHKRVTEANLIEAGQDVFRIACARCHTTTGINSTVDKFNNLYGEGRWDPEVMGLFVETMHNTRTYMPPFPGNQRELDALVAYLKDLEQTHAPLSGAQSRGIPKAVNPDPDARL